LDECADWFNAIDLWIRAGDPAHALDLMADMDRSHLREWGHSDALIPWLEHLDGLTSDRDRVRHAALLGRALAHRGRLDESTAHLPAAVGNIDSALEDIARGPAADHDAGLAVRL